MKFRRILNIAIVAIFTHVFAAPEAEGNTHCDGFQYSTDLYVTLPIPALRYCFGRNFTGSISIGWLIAAASLHVESKYYFDAGSSTTYYTGIRVGAFGVMGPFAAAYVGLPIGYSFQDRSFVEFTPAYYTATGTRNGVAGMMSYGWDL